MVVVRQHGAEEVVPELVDGAAFSGFVLSNEHRRSVRTVSAQTQRSIPINNNHINAPTISSFAGLVMDAALNFQSAAD